MPWLPISSSTPTRCRAGGSSAGCSKRRARTMRPSVLDYASTMKDDAVSGDQPDGQGAGDRPQRPGRHRMRGDLRLSGRCVSRCRARAAARRSRRLLSLAVLRRRPGRTGGDQQGRRVRADRPSSGGCSAMAITIWRSMCSKRRCRRIPISPATASPRPMSMSARRSAGALQFGTLPKRDAFAAYAETLTARDAYQARGGAGRCADAGARADRGVARSAIPARTAAAPP